MSSRGKCSTQIITQQRTVNHDFAVISSITPVMDLFPVRKCVFRLEKIPTEQNRLYILFFAVCLINKLFQMSLIRLAYENCNKGNE